jgi:23S rRNA (cytosine1962-C5)-methyltransferase
VAALARGRSLLDLCCNAGGFALQAARAGARQVRAVDLDEVVLGRAREAARVNGLEIEFTHADAYPFLRSLAGNPREHPEVVVADPHKLVASKRDLESGLRDYSDLNALALSVVRPGGVLATFSCSGALALPAFLGMVFQAARRADRRVRLLETLGAGPDHPQRPEFTRSSYLKGALLAVD